MNAWDALVASLPANRAPEGDRNAVWSFADAEGRFTGRTYAGPAEFLSINTPEGCVAVLGMHDHLSRRLDLETGEVVDYRPPKPEGSLYVDHVWNDEARRWVETPTIHGVAREVDEQLQRERDRRIEGGFTWDGSTFHSDAERSQPRLLGLYGDALNGNYTPGGEWWKLKSDADEWRLLSAEDAVGVWLAFKEHMRACFGAYAKHQAIVGLMVEDGDIEGLRAYDTAADWPA